MDTLQQYVEDLRGFFDQHPAIQQLLIDNQLKVVVVALLVAVLALLFAIWSLVRRRGTHRLRRQVSALEARLSRLEITQARELEIRKRAALESSPTGS